MTTFYCNTCFQLSLFVMLLKHYFCVHSCLEWRSLEGSKVLSSGLPWTSLVVAFRGQDSLKCLESVGKWPEKRGVGVMLSPQEIHFHINE